ncbi:MAG: CRISPR system precrRNA processing endoribonuclease RAMP protein Cas6, partial [Candidatus Omnitrophica bacterium]|nr:CRISPR system precrRNA processing endoribonuclease RAMP protein Cas6 [Candidatus Omnitrophota bacterium]
DKIVENFTQLLEKANSVYTIHSKLTWHDWQRFSLRQKTFMKLGGFTGTITYKGNLKDFLPFIKIGEIIHIGKNTSFGLGKYLIV